MGDSISSQQNVGIHWQAPYPPLSDSLSQRLRLEIEGMFDANTMRSMYAYPIYTVFFNRDGSYAFTQDSASYMIAATGCRKNAVHVGDAQWDDLVGKAFYYIDNHLYKTGFGRYFFATMISTGWRYDEVQMVHLKNDELVSMSYGMPCIIVCNMRTMQCAYDGVVHSSIEHFMQSHHGGIAAYLNKLALERSIERYIAENMPRTHQELLDYMDGSVMFYWLRHMGHEDTMKVVNWFVNDVNQIVRLRFGAKKSLRRLITNRLREKKRDSPFIQFPVELLGRDVRNELRAVLSPEQYDYVARKLIHRHKMDIAIFEDVVIGFDDLQRNGVIPPEYSRESWLKRYLADYRVEIMGEKPLSKEIPQGIIIR
ncbi:MAG: hypothetical protein IJU72_09650 [Bacteroidales bacterium]|nr:hypothetical protein [Bacteroidales bacterium]